jgi:hypothetical protein
MGLSVNLKLIDHYLCKILVKPPIKNCYHIMDCATNFAYRSMSLFCDHSPPLIEKEQLLGLLVKCPRKSNLSICLSAVLPNWIQEIVIPVR